MGNKSGFDLIDDIADPQLSKDKVQSAEDEVAMILKSTFTTVPGKKALNILSYRFFNQECFAGDRPDPYKAAQIDGERKVFKFIFDYIASAK